MIYGFASTLPCMSFSRRRFKNSGLFLQRETNLRVDAIDNASINNGSRFFMGIGFPLARALWP
jgi:hypothetical protein